MSTNRKFHPGHLIVRICQVAMCGWDLWRDLTFCSVFVNIYKTNTQEGVVVLCALRLFQLAFVSMHGRTCWRFSDVDAFLFDPVKLVTWPGIGELEASHALE